MKIKTIWKVCGKKFYKCFGQVFLAYRAAEEFQIPMIEGIAHQYYRSAHRHNRTLPLGNRTRGDVGVTV